MESLKNSEEELSPNEKARVIVQYLKKERQRKLNAPDGKDRIEASERIDLLLDAAVEMGIEGQLHD